VGDGITTLRSRKVRHDQAAGGVDRLIHDLGTSRNHDHDRSWVAGLHLLNEIGLIWGQRVALRVADSFRIGRLAHHDDGGVRGCGRSRSRRGIGPGYGSTVSLDRALETLQDGLPWKLVAVARIAGRIGATSLPAAIGALPAQRPTPALAGEI